MKNEKLRIMKITEWALEDRPREKLNLRGPKNLTNAELLAIILATGTKSMSAVELAKSILSTVNNDFNKLAALGIKELTKIKGVGPAKALTIKAVLEIANRKVPEYNQFTTLTCSQDVYQYLSPFYRDLPHEECRVIFLNNAKKIISSLKISEGGISATVVDPKIIFYHAIQHRATGIILSHNHPSGSLKPSKMDINLTNKVKEASKLMDMTLIDHVILTDHGYFSFCDNGML